MMRSVLRPWVSACVVASALGTVACGDTPTSVNPEGPGALFEDVWQNFDQRYAFFDYRSIDWNQLGDTYRARIREPMSDSALASVIGEMITRLEDQHAVLISPFGAFRYRGKGWAHNYDPAEVVRDYFGGNILATPSHRIGYGWLARDIGYVGIPSFLDTGWGSEIDSALDALREARGLVIDIRDNGGGDERIGLEIAGRFTEVTRTYALTKFRNGPAHADFGPVIQKRLAPLGRRYAGRIVVLTNRYIASAGEDFLLMLRALPNVTVIGDTTAGVGSNPLVLTLANGWTYRVPQSIQMTPDGFIYDGRGLAPDIVVFMADADVAKGRDTILDRAILFLTNPAARAGYRPRASSGS